MRLANLDGRATIVANDGLVDVAGASNGAFSASIDKCLGQLDKLDAWYRSANLRSHRTSRSRNSRSTHDLAPSSIRARFSP